MKNKLPNIVIFIIVGILIMLGVYLFFRIKERVEENRSDSWYSNIFQKS